MSRGIRRGRGGGREGKKGKGEEKRKRERGEGRSPQQPPFWMLGLIDAGLRHDGRGEGGGSKRGKEGRNG